MRVSLYKILGFLCVFLAVLGVLLPLLPTTPFLLLAAWCFARSSERWHQWLINSPVFGVILRDWEQRHCISRSTRMVAFLSLVLFGGGAVLLAFQSVWLKVFAAAVIVVSFYCVSRLSVCDD